jgi:hypothetical protein
MQRPPLHSSPSLQPLLYVVAKVLDASVRGRVLELPAVEVFRALLLVGVERQTAAREQGEVDSCRDGPEEGVHGLKSLGMTVRSA